MSRDITITPVTGTVNAMVLELSNGRLVAAEFSGFNIKVSTDGGATWSANKYSDGHPNANPRSPFVDSNGNLYFSKGLAGGNGYLVRSTDDGETWTKVLDSESNAIWYLAEDLNGDLYCNEYSFGESPTDGWQALNVWKSVDGGITWGKDFTYPTTARHLHLFAIDSNGNKYLSAAHPQNGATDVAATWPYIGGAVGSPFTPQGIGGGMTAFTEATDGTLLFGSDRENGIWKLNGTSFVNVFSTELNILTMVTGRDCVIYATTSSGDAEELYMSADNGITWVIAKLHGTTKAYTTHLTVGRGNTPYIYWDGGYDQPYRRIPDYTRAELRALYTSTSTINGTITTN